LREAVNERLRLRHAQLIGCGPRSSSGSLGRSFPPSWTIEDYFLSLKRLARSSSAAARRTIFSEACPRGYQACESLVLHTNTMYFLKNLTCLPRI
jgi:hypothetical protein